MPKALWNGAVLAEADEGEYEVVEGNVYFPPDKIDERYFRPNDQHTVCAWKGTANYYDVVVDDQVNRGAAWYYPDPKDAAAHIKNHVAFWRGVQIER